MDRATHLSNDDLILFMDGEMDAGHSAMAQQHLLACAECGKRLTALQAGSSVYAQYHDEILTPALAVPERGWSPIRKQSRWSFWWPAVALACGLVTCVIYLQRPSQPSAPELLASAEAAPESLPKALLFTSGGAHLTQPQEFQHVQALFIQANYSWEKPLSARSFAAWRRQLPRKEDVVTSIREDGGRQYYRVRTHTPAGILQTASITLQAGSYRATRADFAFQGEDPLEVSENTEVPPSVPKIQTPPDRPAMTETIAGPEEELRVFAALNAIGADAGDPVDVKLDARLHRVLVIGTGITLARQHELKTALAALPGTIVRFNSGQPAAPDASANPTANTDSEDKGSAFRQKLQARVGGARQWQAMTDDALDTSNTLFTHAHALQVLAQEFPAPMEAQLRSASRAALLNLRQGHLKMIDKAIAKLKNDLQPLSTTWETNEVNTPLTQAGTAELFQSARNLDQLVSRLLAGSYTDQEGEQMLNQLPGNISKLEILTHSKISNNR